ncbi:hypothetical protein [Sinorhizobium medicae]|nr:hypothetical protein [Sinorhizobium medicae]
MRGLVEKIAQVANAVGWQAGEQAMELAGQIVSTLRIPSTSSAS